MSAQNLSEGVNRLVGEFEQLRERIQCGSDNPIVAESVLWRIEEEQDKQHHTRKKLCPEIELVINNPRFGLREG
jgi:hypothetical protein